MKLKHVMVMVVATALIAAASVLAIGAEKTTVVPSAELKWKDMGNGIKAAVVSGDMEKGPSRFFMTYPAGFVTPPHHHTTDHYVTMISGAITLTVEGKDYKLGPGSYFAFVGKPTHVAKVEGSEAAMFYIEAGGAWDAVFEEKK